MKDKVDQGEIKIRKRDTENMWSDVCTKPKQGTPFRKDRFMIMGCPLDWPSELALEPGKSAVVVLEDESRTSPQECVGRYIPSMCAWQIADVSA